MNLIDEEWERRVAELWAKIDDYDESEFRAKMDAVAAQAPSAGAGLFERAGAYDSTGHSDLAVPLYRQALQLGLDPSRRRQATIQLASSLRNLGQASESVALLTAEQNAGSDDLDDAVAGFLALALADAGREREALSVALTALAGHLTRYHRSLSNYARLLPEDEPA
jgi:tetratricopeptide (TPR) repeat protein